MAVHVPKLLYQGQPAATDTTLYTVPADTQTVVTSIIATNTNSATKYFTIHFVQSGDSVANDVALIFQQDLKGSGDSTGSQTFIMDTPFILETAGDLISAIQETATAITVTIFGYEESTA
jgi:hypothetical protein